MRLQSRYVSGCLWKSPVSPLQTHFQISVGLLRYVDVYWPEELALFGTICVCQVRGTGNRLSHGDNDNRGTDCLTHCALPSCERACEPRSRARRRNATVLHGDQPGSRTLEPRASAVHPPQHSWLPLRQFFSKFRCSLFFGGCFSLST